MIYSSDLKRAFKTAEILNESLDVPLHKREQLRECCFGKAEGRTAQDVIEDYGKDLWEKLRGSCPQSNDLSFPDGESPKQVYQRVSQVLLNIIDTTSYQRIGISTHGGVLRNIIHPIIKESDIPLPIPNCVIYHLQFVAETRTWQFLGQVSS